MALTPARPDQIEAIADLVNGAYRGETSRQGWTHEDDYIDGQRTSADALRQDLRRPGAVLLVLEEPEGAPPVGCVWLEPAGQGAWYLGMLTVRPDLQANGTGRRLLEQAEAFAAGRGAQRIRMTVVDIRESLIAWYLRRGYELTGEAEPFPYEDARFGEPRRPGLVFVVLEKDLALTS